MLESELEKVFLEKLQEMGYIWHTTGSGKTLTSFKCATVLKENEDIHKVLFVVDRKDLDKQTVREFNLFEEGCVDETSNTGHLLEKLTNPSVKIIVTTLQKLNRLLDNYRPEVQHLGDKKMVFIFDECHRSQFGESNKKIRDTFKNIQMFGFTGTPIFAENSKKMFTRDYKTKKSPPRITTSYASTSTTSIRPIIPTIPPPPGNRPSPIKSSKTTAAQRSTASLMLSSRRHPSKTPSNITAQANAQNTIDIKNLSELSAYVSNSSTITNKAEIQNTLSALEDAKDGDSAESHIGLLIKLVGLAL